MCTYASIRLAYRKENNSKKRYWFLPSTLIKNIIVLVLAGDCGEMKKV
jgi:hypothetical protein